MSSDTRPTTLSFIAIDEIEEVTQEGKKKLWS